MGSKTLSVHDVRFFRVKQRLGRLGLVFVAPLVAEFLLGNLPIKLLLRIALVPCMAAGRCRFAPRSPHRFANQQRPAAIHRRKHNQRR